MRCAFFLPLVILLSLAGGPALADVAKTPLQGQVSHSETLPQVDPSLKPGESLDEASLKKLSPDNVWVPIPDWYAGTWHFDYETTLSVYSFKRGYLPELNGVSKNVTTRTFGMQKDKNGQIWDFLKAPIRYKSVTSDGTAYNQLLRIDDLDQADKMLRRRLSGTETVVGEGNTIVVSRQFETINTCVPLEDGLVHLFASLKFFDAEGQPEYLKKGEVVMNRIKPYCEIDEQDGLNLKDLFAEFLRKTGRESLIPVASGDK